jgi:hypothetical protein
MSNSPPKLLIQSYTFKWAPKAYSTSLYCNLNFKKQKRNSQGPTAEQTQGNPGKPVLPKQKTAERSATSGNIRSY